MHFFSLLPATAFATIASAHFQLQYPLPRGPFVEDSEPSFCDGYNDAVANRTVFPISNGIIDLNSEHPTWTAGVIISTQQNPTSFADFNSSSGYQLVVPYFQTSGEGKFCFPINITASGVSNIQDGTNVTIQVIYDGGDGTLYQCADLTLSANATVPSNATLACSNVTATPTSSPTASASASATSGGEKNRVTISIVVAAALAGLLSLY